MTSVNRDSINSAATGSQLSQGRKSLRSAAVLDRQEFKGNKLNPSYAIDAEVEGISTAVDRSDDDLKAIDLGKKYSDIFGNVEWVIVDLAGTMVEDMHAPIKPYQGSLEAFNLLKEHEVKLMLVTNSWRSSKSTIVDLLTSADFDVSKDEIFTSSDACKDYLEEKELKRPYYLMHFDVMKDFNEQYPRRPKEDSVVVGLPSTQFDYRLLSKGMGLLHGGAPLITLNLMKRTVSPNLRNLNLGPGPFVNLLATCTDAEPVAVCKPSNLFYESLAKRIGCNDFSKAVVIGDDIYEDISGAKALGFKTILTRTGCYQLHDEKSLCGGAGAPDTTAENFAMAVRCVLSAIAVSQMTEDDFMDEEKSMKACGSLQSSYPKDELLTKKLQAYLKSDSKSNRRTHPIRLPSHIW